MVASHFPHSNHALAKLPKESLFWIDGRMRSHFPHSNHALAKLSEGIAFLHRLGEGDRTFLTPRMRSPFWDSWAECDRFFGIAGQNAIC